MPYDRLYFALECYTECFPAYIPYTKAEDSYSCHLSLSPYLRATVLATVLVIVLPSPMAPIGFCGMTSTKQTAADIWLSLQCKGISSIEYLCDYILRPL